MKKCNDDGCIVGYETNPEGSSFLDIKEYISLMEQGATGNLWGYEAFKYCPDCGCKVKAILQDYLGELV